MENWLSERRGSRVTIRTPRRGAAFERMQIARDNARQNHLRRFRRVRERGEKATLALAKALDLDRRPARIECFDISHLQGSETYASCVVFVDGEPAKDEYRLFRIERPGVDDFASIAEAVTRRYDRVRREGGPMPDLLLIDGGKGQLSAALSALDRLGIEMPAAGLAKREEELFVPGRSAAMVLPRRNPGLKLLQRARDEAHRFGLRSHRRARGKRALESPLLAIPGPRPGGREAAPHGVRRRGGRPRRDRGGPRRRRGEGDGGEDRPLSRENSVTGPAAVISPSARTRRLPFAGRPGRRR